MSDSKFPAPIPVEPSARARLRVYAIGAAFRSGPHIGQPIPDGEPFSFEGPTHVVRVSNASDAMSAYLAHSDAVKLDSWGDDDCSQRLLYVIPVERLQFSRPGQANIEVSTTHRRVNGAPIRYLRG